MNGVATLLNDVWWSYLLRGIALLLFGVVMLAWPGMSVLVLTFVFALFFILSGIVSLVRGIRGITRERLWFLSVILGLWEVGIGAYAFQNPRAALSTLILLFGLGLLIRGILEVVDAFDQGYDKSGRTMLVVLGALGVLAGLIVLRYPATGALAFVWVLGVYGLVTGAIDLAISMDVRTLENRLTSKA